MNGRLDFLWRKKSYIIYNCHFVLVRCTLARWLLNYLTSYFDVYFHIHLNSSWRPLTEWFPQRNYIKQDVMFCHQDVHHHREKSKRLVHPVLFFFLFCSIWNILGGKKFQQQILNTDGCVWLLFFRWLWPPFESEKQKQVQHDLFWVHSQHLVGNYIYSPVCHSLGGVFLVICFCF